MPSLAVQGLTYWVGYGRIAGRRISASSYFRTVDDHARIERQQPIRRSQERVDVELLDPGLLDDQMAEAHEKLFKSREVNRPAAAHAFERSDDPGLFHHPPGQRSVERRQTKRSVLEHLDELPPVPKSSTGPNCGSRLLPMMSS